MLQNTLLPKSLYIYTYIHILQLFTVNKANYNENIYKR